MIVPSIDVRGGRLHAGGDPRELAVRYVAEGAEALHLVDLDAAERGGSPNRALLREVARAAGVPCRIAGGIDSAAAALAAVEDGFAGALLSSAAFADDAVLALLAASRGAGLVEIEARDGRLAPRGGHPERVARARGRDVLDAARAAARAGLHDLYVIDVSSEDAPAGPPLALLRAVRGAVGPDVALHAGGGVRDLHDVRALAREGVASVTIGRALARGRFSVAEAKACA